MIIIDDFLDSPLLDEVQNDETFWGDEGTFCWYPGWWNQAPANTRERLLTEIWSKPELWKLVTEPIEGFEHWVGIRSPNDTHTPEWLIKNLPSVKDKAWALAPHIDKDEGLFAKNGSVEVNPVIGTVFYPWPHKVEGGYLRIWQSQYDSKGNKIAELNYDAPYELVEPKFNRLIIFPNFKELHAVEPITKGERRAIAINLWARKPSTELKNY